jgi:heme A synthase
MGISAVAVILQGLWAGIFLEHDGQRDAASNWIDVHARGADVALAFAVLGTAYALWKRRARKDLWIGGLVFTALIIAESYIGGQIRDASQDTLTAIHVPLAMAIMGLAVWLPVRAARRTS